MPVGLSPLRWIRTLFLERIWNENLRPPGFVAVPSRERDTLVKLAEALTKVRDGVSGSANFEGCDLVAFENEDMFQADGTVREITGHPSDDDCLPVPLRDTERLDRVVVLEACRGIPFPNGRDARKSSPFITNDAMLGETPGQRIGVSHLFRSEIRGNGPG